MNKIDDIFLSLYYLYTSDFSFFLRSFEQKDLKTPIFPFLRMKITEKRKPSASWDFQS